MSRNWREIRAEAIAGLVDRKRADEPKMTTQIQTHRLAEFVQVLRRAPPWMSPGSSEISRPGISKLENRAVEQAQSGRTSSPMWRR